jgi:hypothetical protein
VGIAFFRIRRNYEADTSRHPPSKTEHWQPVILKNASMRVACALIFIGMNMMVLVQSARASGYPPSWLRPAVIGGLVVGGLVYWGAIFIIAKKSDENSPLEIRIVRDGIEVEKEADKVELNKAKQEGNSRVVIYEVCCAICYLFACYHLQ